jgi:hypothetical protein
VQGLRKIFWYVVLAPHDNLQSDATKNTVEILKQSDLPRAWYDLPLCYFLFLLWYFESSAWLEWPWGTE